MEDTLKGIVDLDFFECQVWARLHPHLSEVTNLLVFNPTSSAVLCTNFPVRSRDPAVDLRRPVTLTKLLKYCDSELITCFPAPLDSSTGKSKSPEVKKKAMGEIEMSLRLLVKEEFEDIQDALCFSKNDDDISIDLKKLVESRSIFHTGGNDLKRSPDVKWIGGEDAATAEEKKGAQIVLRLLQYLETSTGFQASAGIGPSFIVAKLAREFNKPRGITVVPFRQVDLLYSQIDLRTAPELKGTRGHVLFKEIFIPGGDQPLRTLLDVRKLTEQFEDSQEMHKKLFSKYPAVLLGQEKCRRLWQLAKGTDECQERPSSPSGLRKSYSVTVGKTETSGKSVEDVVSLGSLRLLEMLRSQLPPFDMKTDLKALTADLLFAIGDSSESAKRCFSVKLNVEDMEDVSVTSLTAAVYEKLEEKLSEDLIPKPRHSIEKLSMRIKLR